MFFFFLFLRNLRDASERSLTWCWPKLTGTRKEWTVQWQTRLQPDTGILYSIIRSVQTLIRANWLLSSIVRSDLELKCVILAFALSLWICTTLVPDLDLLFLITARSKCHQMSGKLSFNVRSNISYLQQIISQRFCNTISRMPRDCLCK